MAGTVARCLHNVGTTANHIQATLLKAETPSYEKTESANDELNVKETIRMRMRH